MSLKTVTGKQKTPAAATPASGSDESAWPLVCIVEKLVEAADILLDEKDYDGHGHELIAFARAEARNWILQNTKIHPTAAGGTGGAQKG